MPEKIIVDPEVLQVLNQRFQRRAATHHHSLTTIRRELNSLRSRGSDGWIGDAANQHFIEMEQYVLPGYERLIESLNEAVRVMQYTQNEFETADREGGKFFQQLIDARDTTADSTSPSSAMVSRLSLNEVLREYQVQSDKMTNWRPSGLGIIPIPFTDEYPMTETEARLLDRLSVNRGLVGLQTFKDIRDQAFDISEKQFSTPTNVPAERPRAWINNDGHRDAFRHAYWNALLTKEFGAEWTTQFTTAHEALPGNTAVREAMDLYNNEVGRQIALNSPSTTKKELAALVSEAVTNGEVVVVDQSGNLAWSEQVPLWKHGRANETPGAGGMPVPDGDASAR